ncbi:hypothetical protein [Yinghuangia soli]|uniref:Uncharacterized protein n=1 Tax=Yinghuangia soli TaxID=2908204 RepID=A0AA41Q9N1_9ACTN|nr:hypothetical protein [Yinghuangia soli]MCF2533465.1 hypothetical protein [Yinghuangia soli]
MGAGQCDGTVPMRVVGDPGQVGAPLLRTEVETALATDCVHLCARIFRPGGLGH